MKEKISLNTPASSKTRRNEFSKPFPGSRQRHSRRIPGFQERNSGRVLKYKEPYLNFCFSNLKYGSSFLGTRSGLLSQGARSPSRVPFPRIRELLVTNLKMIEKISLNTPAGSKTRRNEFSKTFPGSRQRHSRGILGFQERNSGSVPKNKEPYFKSLKTEMKVGFFVLENPVRVLSLRTWNPPRFPFPETRELLVTNLKMKEKISMKTPAGSKTRRNEFSKTFPGSRQRHSRRIPGFQERNSVSVPKNKEPYLNFCFSNLKQGYSFLGTRSGFLSQGTRNPPRLPFPRIRELLVNYLKTKAKRCRNTPASSDTRRNEFSNVFPGSGFLGTELDSGTPGPVLPALYLQGTYYMSDQSFVGAPLGRYFWLAASTFQSNPSVDNPFGQLTYIFE